MPEAESSAVPSERGTADASRLGAGEVLAGEGPNAFALPASHSVRLAQAAAVTTGALALLVLGLRFVDLREPQGDLSPLAPAAALDRTEVDLPSLTKPVRSDIPRFRGDDHPEGDVATPEASELASATAAPPLTAHEPAAPAETARTAAVAPHPTEHAPEMPFAGVWGPDDSACTPRTNHAGYLPAVITPQGAFAGETSCAFRNPKAVPGGWSVAASCQSPKGRWTTQVRLTVAGRRLTWSSARGTQTYVRCGETSAPRAKG